MIREKDVDGKDSGPRPPGVIPYPDKQYKKDRERVRKLFYDWTQLMGLRFWHCDIFYVRGYVKDKQGDINPNVPFIIECDWRYQKLEVSCSLYAMTDYDDQFLRYCMCHELTHALVCEMRALATHPTGSQEATDHEERVVTWIAKAFGWVYDAAYDAGFVAGKKASKKKGKK